MIANKEHQTIASFPVIRYKWLDTNRNELLFDGNEGYQKGNSYVRRKTIYT